MIVLLAPWHLHPSVFCASRGCYPLAMAEQPGAEHLPEPVFRGVGVALVTLFNGVGDADAPATASLARRLAELGLAAIVVAGSTGEAESLDDTERTALIVETRRALPKGVALLAGVGAASARQAVELTKAARDCGADALLALSPRGSSDVRPYYAAVARAAGATPVLAYHFPSASAPGIPVSVLPDLPVQGLKDSSGELARLHEELDVYDGPLYIGSADLVFAGGAMGCAGAILAIANVCPELAVKAFTGDAGAQRSMSAAARRTLSRRPFSLKEAVAERFGTSPACRMG